MDGTAMDVLLAYVGGRSSAVTRRFVRATALAVASRGTERSHDNAFIEADAVLFSEGLVESYASFARDNQR